MKKTEIEERIVEFSVEFLRLVMDFQPDPETDQLIDGVLGPGVDRLLDYDMAITEESKFESVNQLIEILNALRNAHYNLIMLQGMVEGGKEDRWEKIIGESDEFLSFIMKAIEDKIKSPGQWNEVPPEMDE